jgi:arabinoxylan arabinofuranohydrolase
MSKGAEGDAPGKLTAYLFVYFTGNAPEKEQIHFAVSEDGYNYKALNNNQPVIDSKTHSASGGLRDPHILRGADGKTFFMVATDLHVQTMGWNNHAMVLMKSPDLINWTSSVVNIPKTFPQFRRVDRVWAPQTIYDEMTRKYMIYFSMKEPRRPDKFYYAYANNDFAGLESAPKQFYSPPRQQATIDADIVKKDNKYHLFYKGEDREPGIHLAISDRLTGGYRPLRKERVDRSRDPVEGSGIFKLNDRDEWILMYDLYKTGRYQFTRSSDLLNFEVIDNQVTMDFHPRHGAVMPITTEELQRLLQKWGAPPTSHPQQTPWIVR